jgi:hypothetical protein
MNKDLIRVQLSVLDLIIHQFGRNSSPFNLRNQFLIDNSSIIIDWFTAVSSLVQDCSCCLDIYHFENEIRTMLYKIRSGSEICYFQDILYILEAVNNILEDFIVGHGKLEREYLSRTSEE